MAKSDAVRQAIAPYAQTVLRDLGRLVDSERERELLALAARSLAELLPLDAAAADDVDGGSRSPVADDAEENRLKRDAAKMAMVEATEDRRRERRLSAAALSAPPRPANRLPPIIGSPGGPALSPARPADNAEEEKETLLAVPERMLASGKADHGVDEELEQTDGVAQTMKLGILSPMLSSRTIGGQRTSPKKAARRVTPAVSDRTEPLAVSVGAESARSAGSAPALAPPRTVVQPPAMVPAAAGAAADSPRAALACAPFALLCGRGSADMAGGGGSADRDEGLLMRRRHTAALALMSHHEDSAASRFVFLPGSRFIRTWEYGILLAILWVVVTAPLRLGFSLWGDAWFPFDVITDLMFAMDIAISCNTAFQDPETDKMVAQRKVIARRYLSGGAFVIDFLSAFPFYALSDSNFARMLLMLKPLRLTRVSFITSRAAHTAQSTRLRNVLKIGFFAVIIHCVACAYWALAVEEEAVVDSSSEWMPRDDWAWLYERYANAFHWTLTSTLKSGARPETYNQYVFSSLVLLIGEVLQAYLIGSITEILTTLNLAEAEKKAQLDNVTTFLSRRRVDTDLRRRIIEFFDYRWSVGYSVKEHEQLLSQLPSQLSLELSLELKRTLIDKVPMLRSLPPESVVMVAESLHATLAVPDELIVVQGVVGTSMFFLNRGVVHMEYTPPDLADQTEPLEVQTMSIGASFGEDSLVTKKPRVATVRALTFCDMQRLSYRAYKKISVLSPEFKTAVENAHKQKNAIVQGLARSSKLLRKMAAPSSAAQSQHAPGSFSTIAADAARAMGQLSTALRTPHIGRGARRGGGGGGAASFSWRSGRSVRSLPSQRSNPGSAGASIGPTPAESPVAGRPANQADEATLGVLQGAAGSVSPPPA